MKKSILFSVLILMTILDLALSLGSALAQGKKITAKLADIFSPDHPHTRTWNYFAGKVKEKTKGRMEVQVYHSGQLGQTKDLYLGLQTGNIEMAKVPTSFTGEWIPEVYVFDLPYLFRDRDEMWGSLHGPVGKKFFNEIYPKQNLIGVMWTDDGSRSIYTLNKPVRKPEDLKGLKIRVTPSEIQIQSINEMGGIATLGPWSETYSALQHKILDGAENSPVLFWTSKHWEICKAYSLTEQSWFSTPLLANKTWWDGLSKETQGQLEEASREAGKYFLKVYGEVENKAIGWVKEKGVEIITDVDKSLFEKRVQPVYEAFVKKYAFGKELLDEVKTAAKKK